MPRGASPTAFRPGRLGTFGGVFTPSVLTILGLILFLRLGTVVGNVGLTRALVVIALANAISVLTSLSLGAIATNFRVRGGGDYFLISRTLGVEFGGALGAVLFLAQSISIAFYLIGFTEAVSAITGLESAIGQRALALGVLALLLVVVWLGADLATRFQYGIMAALFLALAAFFAGGIPRWDASRFGENLAAHGSLPFWAAFALFFPAVTGFTQGVSMSGDLADPGKSLPRGTLLAVGFSFAVYLLVAVVFAGAVEGSVLVSDPSAMRGVSPLPALVDLGVIAATVSSALASFLGAPRILQSLARDKVFPWLIPFGAGAGPAENPRRAILLAGAIAVGGILVGAIDLLAPIVTMFFLISYGHLNYATYHEARAKSPSFRPRFRWFDARLSLLGALGCGGAMLAIDPLSGAIAFASLMAIHFYLNRTVTIPRWSDSTRSALFQRVRDDLHRMGEDIEHPRSWRPSILAFSDDPERRERLTRFASWIEGGSGLTTAVRILSGGSAASRRRRDEAEQELRADFRERGVRAFPLVVLAPDPVSAFEALLQGYGLGPIRANIVLLNWFDQEGVRGDSPGLRAYARHLRTALRFGCSVIILHASRESFPRLAPTRSAGRRIDLWWTGDGSSRLSLLLAHLMRRSEEWEEAAVRVLAPVRSGATEAETREELERMLEEVRIDARPEVVPALDGPTVARISRDASLVFLPFRIAKDRPRGPFEEPLPEVIEALPLTALVLAAQDLDLEAEPDEGPAADVASAHDAAESARRQAESAAKDAAAAADRLREAEGALAKARENGEPLPRLAELEAEVERARKEVEQAARRAAREDVKSVLTSREAEEARLEAESGAAGPPPERAPGGEEST